MERTDTPSVLKKSSDRSSIYMDRPPGPVKFLPPAERASWLFRIYLKILILFKPFYLWAKRKWPKAFAKYLGKEADLDTSRMLPRFNALHRFFFGKGMEKIRFDEAELKHLESALQKGPVIFLMKNWGQVEYNFFNHLFLKEKTPLVAHNNMIKMGHWMPWDTFVPVHRQKVDLFYQEKAWPYNHSRLDLTEHLLQKKPVLYCLNLPKASPWVEKNLSSQESIVGEWMEAQSKLKPAIQLVPLNFIYDKHPGKERRSLGDIFFGDRENPGYSRKIILFLRNYKKRAVAKIGEPIDFRSLLEEFPHAPPQDKIRGILRVLQKTYQHEKLQVTGPKLKSRRTVMEEILSDEKLQTRLEALAKDQNLSPASAQKRARKSLKEICSDVRFTFIEIWNVFLSWLFNRFYDGLHVDTEGINEIKKVARKSPIVLIPSHKSHVDYLIFSYVFYHHDLSLPLVCAGNNLNFWPLGPIFRRSGAYFIRRTFAGDPIYAASLKAYVAQLMREGSFQEFFIEGTRSRSGKLFPPRSGMLRIILETYLENREIPDVYLVPASIDYERILEEGAYLDEVKGAKKDKERFRDLLHLPKFLRRRYGKVYVQFAEPISLKDALKEEGKDVIQGQEALRDFSSQMADRIIRAINRVSTLLPSSLAALALLYPKTKSITSKEVHAKGASLFQMTKTSSPRISEALEKNFHHAIQEALSQFVGGGLIKFHDTLEEKFYSIPEESRLPLEFYKNGGMHVFVEAALNQLVKGDVETETKLKKLLSRDFFFSPEKTPIDLSQAPPWLHEILLPTLESYWLTLKATSELNFKKMEEWLLMRKVLQRGELLLLKGEVRYPESLSRFNIQNALAQLTELGVLQNHVKEMGPKGKKYYSPGASSQRREEVKNLLGRVLQGKSK
jgi:glycerol-3-phosphate O-acyltransferase